MSQDRNAQKVRYVLFSAIFVMVLLLVFWIFTDKDRIEENSTRPKETVPEPDPAAGTPSSSESEPPAEEIIPPVSAPAEPDSAQHAHIGVAAYRDTVTPGGALLTGGWPLPNGSHMFALVSPTLRPEDAPDAVEISGRIFAISPERMNEPGWKKMLEVSDNGMHVNGASYSPDQLIEFQKNYNSELNQAMSAPRVVTLFGRPATIQVVGGSSGYILSVIADENAAGGGLNLAVTVAEYGGMDSETGE